MKNIWLLSILLLLAGCNEFLDERPSKGSNVEISTVDHLDALLGNTNIFTREDNGSAVFSTDDWGMTCELYTAITPKFDLTSCQYFCWDIENLPTEEYFWGEEYTKIFYANLILSNLDNVSGDEELKEELRAEAYLIRAYSNFQLVNTFALPYTEENKNEPGITLKLTNSFDESVERRPIHEVYSQIEADLTEALKAPNPIDKDDVFRPWRGNSAAAKAFAARYWLTRGDYETSLYYADEALKEYGELLNYNTEMNYYDQTYEVGPEGENEVILPETWSPSGNAIYWKEFYFVRYVYQAYGWYVPSEDLLSLYDQTYDLRYRYHIVEHFSQYWNDDYPSSPGYVFFGQYNAPSGPTVAEMILTKAECQARQGNYTDAMNTVNILRANRIDASAPSEIINLSASSQEEAVRKILEERRREMPFSMRWYDLRRLNNNEDPSDDKALKRVFYPMNATSVLTGEEPIVYTLPVDSRRWASPLPFTEIETSQGVIEQNRY